MPFCSSDTHLNDLLSAGKNGYTRTRSAVPVPDPCTGTGTRTRTRPSKVYPTLPVPAGTGRVRVYPHVSIDYLS